MLMLNVQHMLMACSKTGMQVKDIEASYEDWLHVLVSKPLACSMEEAEATARRVEGTPVLQCNDAELGVDENRLKLWSKQKEQWSQKVMRSISTVASQTTDVFFQIKDKYAAKSVTDLMYVAVTIEGARERLKQQMDTIQQIAAATTRSEQPCAGLQQMLEQMREACAKAVFYLKATGNRR